MASYGLTEVDSLQIVVVVDDELDPISPSNNPQVQYVGQFQGIPMAPITDSDGRAGARAELRMDNICCGAHGLSLMITATKGEEKHTILFDTGPEEDIWEKNATRLRADIGSIERIITSHWHRDHTGGLPHAIKLINQARGDDKEKVTVDLHPDRPAFRGFKTPTGVIVSLEADPTFKEVEDAGGLLEKHGEIHTVGNGSFLVSGEIPRKTEYELGIRGAIRLDQEKGTWVSDELLMDERFVAVNLKGKGLVVFTGCSHAGVINVSRHALELGQGLPLHAVVGGFHLADNNPEKLARSLEDLRELKPTVLLPGHCTGYKFKFMIEQAVPGSMVPSFVGVTYAL